MIPTKTKWVEMTLKVQVELQMEEDASNYKIMMQAFKELEKQIPKDTILVHYDIRNYRVALEEE